MTRAKVGLLPFYLELYDRVMPSARAPMAAFSDTIASQLAARGVEVMSAQVCRVRAEFAAAVESFEAAGADAIVTLHLAYSPSLESADVLAASRLPVIVLDTTPDDAFGPGQDPALLMNNHGVHGVQDLCNMLRRRGKPFVIEAGHWRASDVLDRVCAHAMGRSGQPATRPPGPAPAATGQAGIQANDGRADRLAAAIRRARVGRIGRPFEGMGDFQVDEGLLRSAIGMEVTPVSFSVLRDLMPAAGDPAVDREICWDHETFAADQNIDLQVHTATVRVSLAVRRWIERERLTAFTVNFCDVGVASGLPAVPFLEASKGMARGIGYAGEGDVLTAGLVGALASVFPETSFTEIFCPDWAENTLFLSHMAEMNIGLCAGRASLLVKSMPWLELGNPVVAVGRFKGGRAVFVNLAPGPGDSFSLILAPVSVVDVPTDRMDGMVRGWIRPAGPIAEFLEAYSRAGGTHHAAIVYGDVCDDLARFGAMMHWDVVKLT